MFNLFTYGWMSSYHLFPIIRLIQLLLFLTVVIWHGDDGQNQVDEVERPHEDDYDEEGDVDWSVGGQDLQYRISNMETEWLYYIDLII